MANSWDRPANSSIPNRQGDFDAEPIYLALGKAVSAWEGVGAAISAAFFAMLSDEDRNEIDCTKLDQFGDINKVHRRTKQLRERWDEFAGGSFGSWQSEVEAITAEIHSVLPAIRGWAERRNDLAHGYVTEAEGPDYTKDDQPIVTHYALCPSHARSSKWPHAEPIYNYVSHEICSFSNAFERLDREIETIAERIEAVRAHRT